MVLYQYQIWIYCKERFICFRKKMFSTILINIHFVLLQNIKLFLLGHHVLMQKNSITSRAIFFSRFMYGIPVSFSIYIHCIYKGRSFIDNINKRGWISNLWEHHISLDLTYLYLWPFKGFNYVLEIPNLVVYDMYRYTIPNPFKWHKWPSGQSNLLLKTCQHHWCGFKLKYLP